jgi:hypothetical protein
MKGDSGRRVPGGVRAGRRQAFALLAVVAGLVLLVASGLVIWRGQGVSEVGAGDAARLSTPTPTATARPARVDVPVTDGRRLPAAAVPPVRLAIPAIGLAAPVDQVGIVAATGEYQVPSDVDRLGWYQFGPDLAATAGSIVVAGHVDGAGQGRGAFFRLAELAPGDRIDLADAAGTGYGFEVVAREVYPKEEIPLDRYFARDGELRLTLITCGGDFDSGARRYSDNVVVTAVPVR